VGNRDAIVALRDATAAYFVANDVPAVVARVGLKYRTFQVNQGPGGGSRVVFIPGEFDGSLDPKPMKLSELAMPRKNVTDTGNPRELFKRTLNVTLSIWAVDTSKLSDEEAQWCATSDLAELTIQGARNGQDPESGKYPGLANLLPYAEILNRTAIENTFGFELLLQCRLGSVYLDQPSDTTTPQPAIARDPAS
jgi:hypothetical protein